MPMAPAPCRSSARRSERTSSAPPRASRSPTRSSPATRACASRGPSSTPPSIDSPAGCSALGLDEGRPAGRVEPEPLRVDAGPVRDGEARGDPREHQPGLPDVRARVRAAPVRLPGAGGRAGVQGIGLRGDGRGGARRAPRARAASSSSTRPSGSALAAGEGGPDAAALRARDGRARTSTIPSTFNSRAARLAAPKGATLTHFNLLNNALLQVAEAMLSLTDRDRICVPVPLYHCFGMVMGNLGCLTHGAALHVYPERRIRTSWRSSKRFPGRAVHQRCMAFPPCLSPSWIIRSSKALRSVQPAHRHHGRLSVSRSR